MGIFSSKRFRKQRSIPEGRLPEKPLASSTPAIVSSTSDTTLSTGVLISRDGTLSSELVNTWEAVVSSNPKLSLSRSILPNNDICKTLQSWTARNAALYVFNNVLKHNVGPITDQGSSGRCWLFAATNVLRYKLMKSHDLKTFQLSQSYLAFWDKLNKANSFLELSIQLADVPLEDRHVSLLFAWPSNDGGEWDMAINLFEKYGVVPQKVFPESHHSADSGVINNLLDAKLREHALLLRSLSVSLRQAADSDKPVTEENIVNMLRIKKEEVMKEIYTILTTVYGAVPSPDEKFVWAETCSCCGPKDSWEGTPREFYEKVVLAGRYNPSESLSLVNDPRNELNKLYTVDKSSNVWGGRPLRWLNVDIEKMKDAVVAMIKHDHPVFFSCDISKFTDKKSGILDPALFEYERTFEITLGLSKADRLRSYDSSPSHCMVISGVHLDTETGKPVRYQVENSWGSDFGRGGWFVMSDKWFEDHVFKVVLHKTCAPSELIELWQGTESTVVSPWDPFACQSPSYSRR